MTDGFRLAGRARGRLAVSASIAPILVAAAAVGVLTGNDAMIKDLARRNGVADIAAARYVFGALVGGLIFVIAGARPPARAVLPGYVVRACFTASTSLLFFYSLSRLPISQAIAISFIAPALIALIARIFLGEKVSGATAASIAISFLGVLVIGYEDIFKWRNSLDDGLGFAAALAAAFTYAASLVLLRAQTATDSIYTIVFVTNGLAAVALAPVALAVGDPIAALARDWPLFLVVGIVGGVGHLLVAYAFSKAPAARIGAVDYTALLWASLLGVIFFNEWPSGSTLAGAALITCGAGLLLMAKSRTGAPTPVPPPAS